MKDNLKMSGTFVNLQKATRFATTAHGGQTRKGEPDVSCIAIYLY
ncbi:MAG: hypothetical protein Q7S57_01715 [bacterium]|nr:hypothetical protein [bacterium]